MWILRFIEYKLTVKVHLNIPFIWTLTKFIKKLIFIEFWGKLQFLLIRNNRTWKWIKHDFTNLRQIEEICVCLMVINANFSNISVISVAISFIDGGNRRTRRKPPTCLKSVTNFITTCCTPRPDRYFNLQHQWW
jgi:hypothetical protein